MVRAFSLVFVALTVSLSCAVTQAGGKPAGGRPMGTAARGGISLTLQLAGSAYPQNALVPATIRLHNGSGQTIETWDCLRTSLYAAPAPNIRPLAPSLLPPPGAPFNACPGGMTMGMGRVRQPVVIPAGNTLTRTMYVVLSAFAVRAVASLQLHVKRKQAKPVMLETAPIHVRQTYRPGPSVKMVAGKPGTALVTPVPGGGPLLYSESAYCGGAGQSSRTVQLSANYGRWLRASGDILHPTARPCANLREWVLFVAQPGLPIAQAYYCAQRRLCIYARPSRREVAREKALAACKRGVGKAAATGQLPRDAVRYAIGLSSQMPHGLTPAQQALARRFHTRCAPLLHPRTGAMAAPVAVSLLSIVLVSADGRQRIALTDSGRDHAPVDAIDLAPAYRCVACG